MSYFKLTLYCLFMLLGLGTASMTVNAQQNNELNRKNPADIRNMPYISPDTIGTKQAMEMKASLNLNDKQYKKVRKLLVKREKERRELMFSQLPDGVGGRFRPEGRPEGMPPRREGMGGGPGGGMRPGGDFPGGDMPRRRERPSDDESVAKMKKANEKFMKNMKKILNDEQYDKWIKTMNNPSEKGNPRGPK